MNPRRILLVSFFLAGCALPFATADNTPAPAPAAALPPDSAYVTVSPEGHLSLDGRRQRYWAAIGKLLIQPKLTAEDAPEQRAQKIADARRGTEVLLQRFSDLGFNAFRMWDVVPEGGSDYTPGDGSPADAIDHFLAEAGRRGFRIWIASLNRSGHARPEDADILDDPATAEAWRAAVASSPGGRIDLRESLARVWDPRLEAVRLRRHREIATHLNRHNGLRWADDPVFAVWELSNEEWWMRKMTGGAWQKLPDFFRRQLLDRWNAYLKSRYADDEALRAAWGGLLPGESLADGSVLFAPMAGATSSAVSMNDANEQARAALAGVAQTYSRADFAPARGADVHAFLLDLQLAHKRREEAALKPLGKSTRLSPLIYDTGIGYEIQSQYLHQSADAVAHDAYVNGWGPAYREPELADAPTPQQAMLRQLDAERIAANDGPWVNWLLKPPGISQGIPWLEHNRAPGKPFLCYETQIQQPAKYRADFPLRIAALAAIQDWDWICWHYFASADDVGVDPRPWDKPMDITTGRHPQGYHYTYDEVQNASMRSAAHVFRGGLLAPAPSPTTFIYGRKSLLDPASMDYAGSYGERGMDMFPTTYQHGVRILIDPTREDDVVAGPVVKFADRNTHNPYTPTDEIRFDWKQGYLRFDAPGVAAFTGLLARQPEGRVVFERGGVTLRDVTIHNPEGIYSPVAPEENYLAFSLQAHDDRPLAETRHASLTLVSTSFNTGFELGENFIEGYGIRAGTVKQGTLPVLVARVGAVIEAPALAGMRYVFRDWHMNPLAEGLVGADGLIRISAQENVFTVELHR